MTGIESAPMMAAMMLPSMVAMLRHDHGGPQRTAIVAGAYLSVWAVIGVATYPLSVALMGLEMRQPIAAGIIVVVAGALQLTKWKSQRLAGCHRPLQGDSAWRQGLALGVRCVQCCANLMLIMLAFGGMDYRVMAIVTAAITIERLAPVHGPVARRIGAAAVAAGVFLIVHPG